MVWGGITLVLLLALPVVGSAEPSGGGTRDGTVATCGNGIIEAGESCDGDDAFGACGPRCRGRWPGARVRPTHTVEAPCTPGCNWLAESLAGVGSKVLIGGFGTAELVDPSTGTPLLTLVDDPGGFYSMAATERWVVLGYPGDVRLFDAATGQLVRRLSPLVPLDSTNFGRSVWVGGNYVLVSDPGLQKVYEFDAESGALLQEFATPGLDASGNYSYPLLRLGSHVWITILPAVYVFDAETAELQFTLRVDDDSSSFGWRMAADRNDVFVGGSRRVYRFDGTTGALRTTYSPAFIELLAAGSGRVLVRGPGCNRVGRLYLLDAESGSPVDSLCPSVDFQTEGGLLLDESTIAVSGSAFDGSSRVYIYGSCANGVLEPGEECDDGNQVDGDGCDHNCTVTRCFNGVHTAGESCPFDDLDLPDLSLGFSPWCSDRSPTTERADLMVQAAQVFAEAAMLTGNRGKARYLLRFAQALLRRIRQLSFPSQSRPFADVQCRALMRDIADLDLGRIRTVLRRRRTD